MIDSISRRLAERLICKTLPAPTQVPLQELLDPIPVLRILEAPVAAALHGDQA